MSFIVRAGAVAAAAIVSVCGGSAAAAVVTYTFTGVADGYGGAGEVLGFAGQTFADHPFTLTFRRDDATPGAVFQSTATSSSITGTGSVAPVTATLVFNGVTIEFGLIDSNNGKYGQAQRDGASELFVLYSEDTAVQSLSSSYNKFITHNVQIYANGLGSDYLQSGDYHTLPSLTPATTPLWSWSGHAAFSEEVRDTQSKLLYSKDNGKIYFNPVSMTIQTSAVPEPETWALLIVGFASTGIALRRVCRSSRGGHPTALRMPCP